jgi:hypothetical protein
LNRPKHTAVHARSGGAGEAPAGSGAEPADLSPLAAALRGLTPPRHGPDFWDELDRRLADEPQLRLAPRSAIRPITQPPPVIDDAKLAKGLKATDIPSPSRSSSRRTLLLAALAVLALLIVAVAVQAPEDEAPTEAGPSQPEDTGGRAPTSDPPATPPTTPAPTVPPGTIDPAAPLTPAGVGPLAIGASLADLQAAGLTIQHDDSMFTSSGGSCYEARVRGALDLRLRFRAPDGERGTDDPRLGVLAAVSIESGLPTARTSDTRIGLGAPEQQVLAAYGGNLDERAHPFVSGGHILRADAGNGTGIAFMTDGAAVIGVSVGEMDAIRFVNECG